MRIPAPRRLRISGRWPAALRAPLWPRRARRRVARTRGGRGCGALPAPPPAASRRLLPPAAEQEICAPVGPAASSAAARARLGLGLGGGGGGRRCEERGRRLVSGAGSAPRRPPHLGRGPAPRGWREPPERPGPRGSLTDANAPSLGPWPGPHRPTQARRRVPGALTSGHGPSHPAWPWAPGSGRPEVMGSVQGTRTSTAALSGVGTCLVSVNHPGL